MTKFRITTNAGYCGTNEEYIEEFESEEEAEAWGYEQLESMISVYVEEIEDEEDEEDED
jgi:hypothetical protein